MPAERALQAIWLRHPTNTVINDLMRQGCEELMQKGASASCLRCFEEIVAMDPSFAEAWNKIATVKFLQKQCAFYIHFVRNAACDMPVMT
jgi:hypothetical protein